MKQLLFYGFDLQGIWLLHGFLQSAGGPVGTAIMGNWFGSKNRYLVCCSAFAFTLVKGLHIWHLDLSPICGKYYGCCGGEFRPRIRI